MCVWGGNSTFGFLLGYNGLVLWVHCLSVGEYKEEILLLVLFSEITLSRSVEGNKERLGEGSTSQGGREEKTQDSQEL